MSKVIQRHTRQGIVIHWFNAACWFFLLATGLGLVENPALQPLGAWWPNMMKDIFDGGGNLLAVHWKVGALWLGVWAFYIVVYLTRLVLPFIKGIVTISPKRDTEWLIKKQLQMVAGHKTMADLVKPLGMDGRIPDQDYYNVGQKAAAVPLILGALVLAATGVVMVLSSRLLGAEWTVLVQWSITIHYLMAGLTTAVLLIHIYMSSVSLEERPALMSMFTGEVPEEYARHHHKLWHERVKDQPEKI